MGVCCSTKLPRKQKYEILENIPDSISTQQAKQLNGEVIKLSDLLEQKKTPIVITNLSRNSLSAKQQLTELNALYSDYNAKGLEILGFHCNQFSDDQNQKKFKNEELKLYWLSNYGVNFRLFEEIDVNGPNTHPIYKYLKSKEQYKDKLKNQGRILTGDFTKYLLDKDGQIINVFDATDDTSRQRNIIESQQISADLSQYSIEKSQSKDKQKVNSLFEPLSNLEGDENYIKLIDDKEISKDDKKDKYVSTLLVSNDNQNCQIHEESLNDFISPNENLDLLKLLDNSNQNNNNNKKVLNLQKVEQNIADKNALDYDHIIFDISDNSVQERNAVESEMKKEKKDLNKIPVQQTNLNKNTFEQNIEEFDFDLELAALHCTPKKKDQENQKDMFQKVEGVENSDFHKQKHTSNHASNKILLKKQLSNDDYDVLNKICEDDIEIAVGHYSKNDHLDKKVVGTSEEFPIYNPPSPPAYPHIPNENKSEIINSGGSFEENINEPNIQPNNLFIDPKKQSGFISNSTTNDKYQSAFGEPIHIPNLNDFMIPANDNNSKGFGVYIDKEGNVVCGKMEPQSKSINQKKYITMPQIEEKDEFRSSLYSKTHSNIPVSKGRNSLV